MKKAFTLIELLVVVVIIGILAAVGVVAYNGYTQSTKYAAAKANYQTAQRYLIAEIARCNSSNRSFSYTPSNSNLSAPAPLKCPASFSNYPDPGVAQKYFAVVLEDKFKNPFDTSVSAYSSILYKSAGGDYKGLNCEPGYIGLSNAYPNFELFACFGSSTAGSTAEFAMTTIYFLQ